MIRVSTGNLILLPLIPSDNRKRKPHRYQLKDFHYKKEWLNMIKEALCTEN
jgi:hypothetical protein